MRAQRTGNGLPIGVRWVEHVDAWMHGWHSPELARTSKSTFAPTLRVYVTIVSESWYVRTISPYFGLAQVTPNDPEPQNSLHAGSPLPHDGPDDGGDAIAAGGGDDDVPGTVDEHPASGELEHIVPQI